MSRRLEIVSLRKSAALVAEAAEHIRQGGSVALPTECGYFAVSENYGKVRLSSQAPKLDDPRLALAAETFWPGPFRMSLPAVGGGKTTWYVPSHPLAQALLRECEAPLQGELITTSAGAAQCGDPGTEVVLVWKERPTALPWSEVDASGMFWRWIRSGFVERREFEWVTSTPTLLSGPAVPEPRIAALPVETAGDEMPYWRVEV